MYLGRKLSATLLAVVAVVLVVMVAACGDGDASDDGDPATSYLQQIGAIASLANVQIAGLEERHPAAFEDLEATKAYYSDYVETYSRFLDSAKQIPVPESLVDERQEYLASSEAILALVQARNDELAAATTIEEAQAILVVGPDLTAAVTRRDTACQVLKALADEKEVNVAGLEGCITVK